MKYNIENRIKDTAIVNLTDFENAIDLYEDGEIEKALELMFGITVLGLGGDFETDDREVRRLLRNREYTVVKSNEAFCNKLHSKEVSQRAKLQLDDIAEMMANGATQQVIADTLGVSLNTIKYRIRIMKEKFPSLYAESTKKYKKVGLSGNNENENVNENVNENDNVKLSAEGLKKLAELDEYINDQIERVMEEKGYKLVKDFDVSVDRIQLDKEYSNRKKQILKRYKLS